MRRARAQEGFVATVAATVLFMILLVLGATMVRAMSTTETSRHDLSYKRALQAADAGLRMAVYEMNGLAIDLSAVLSGTNALAGQCVVALSTGISASNPGLHVGGAWCAAVHDDLGNGAAYDYQASPMVDVQTGGAANLTHTLQRRIVSTGTVNGVRRRVTETVTALGTSSTGALGTTSTKITQIYRPDAGTYRECPSSAPSGSNPAANCPA